MNDDLAPGTIRYVRDGEVIDEADFIDGIEQQLGGHIEFHSSDRDLVISQVRSGLGLLS